MNDVTNTVNPTDMPKEEMVSWVRGLLHNEAVQDLCITFTKGDGTSREMRCTLREQLIPHDKLPKGTGREPPDSTQRVFDVDKQEWRSFKWDSVTSIKFSLKD